MNHAELSSLWADQEDRYAEWREALQTCCHSLRDALRQKIGAPNESWINPQTGRRHQYVEVIYLDSENTRIKGHIPPEALTDDGTLMFGLAVTFDRGKDSFPKEVPYLRLAVKFTGGLAHYSFFDLELREAESPPGWVADLAKFVDLCAERFRDYLSFDPFQGEKDCKGIGFL